MRCYQVCAIQGKCQAKYVVYNRTIRGLRTKGYRTNARSRLLLSVRASLISVSVLASKWGLRQAVPWRGTDIQIPTIVGALSAQSRCLLQLQKLASLPTSLPDRCGACLHRGMLAQREQWNLDEGMHRKPQPGTAAAIIIVYITSGSNSYLCSCFRFKHKANKINNSRER